jgi:hypothetical protein
MAELFTYLMRLLLVSSGAEMTTARWCLHLVDLQHDLCKSCIGLKEKLLSSFQWTIDDLLSKCGDGSKWDLLMVAWDFELEFGVQQKLRSTAYCCIPSLAYEQSRAPAPRPSTEQARSARH